MNTALILCFCGMTPGLILYQSAGTGPSDVPSELRSTISTIQLVHTIQGTARWLSRPSGADANTLDRLKWPIGQDVRYSADFDRKRMRVESTNRVWKGGKVVQSWRSFHSCDGEAKYGMEPDTKKAVISKSDGGRNLPPAVSPMLGAGWNLFCTQEGNFYSLAELIVNTSDIVNVSGKDVPGASRFRLTPTLGALRHFRVEFTISPEHGGLPVEIRRFSGDGEGAGWRPMSRSVVEKFQRIDDGFIPVEISFYEYSLQKDPEKKLIEQLESVLVFDPDSIRVNQVLDVSHFRLEVPADFELADFRTRTFRKGATVKPVTPSAIPE